jgi:hypothetical protein
MIRTYLGSSAARYMVVAGLMLISLGKPAVLPSVHAEESGTIARSEEYFPDEVGNRWMYRGQISEGPLQTIDQKVFSNVSSVTGTKSIKGLKITVFHDTNPGNHGPSDSFYRRDVVGIVYYGSEPGTPLEKQLIPYQIIRFPMKVGASFQQFDRTALDFGSDMDRDGSNEKADVRGHATVVGLETITVPAGTFKEAVKVEAHMTMRIYLSGTDQSATGTDIMTAWFARGVGLIKYAERQELSSIQDRGVVTEITEELESYEVKPAKTSFDGREAPPQGIFADNSGHRELHQIVVSPRL